MFEISAYLLEDLAVELSEEVQKVKNKRKKEW